MTDAKIKISAADNTQGAFASISRNFDSLQGKLGGLGLAIPALSFGAAAGALAALTLEASKAIDEFNDLKDATGASIENISALDRVARETGGSFDTVATSLIKFNKMLNDSGTDGSRAAEILKSLGLNAAELKNQDPAEAMRQLAVAFSGFADDGAKGRAILELTGKSARQLAPFLKDLSEQTSLQAKTSTAAAEEAEKFNKELYALKANGQDFARAISTDVVTALNEVIAKFREGQKEGKGFFEIAWERYKDNIKGFYGIQPPSKGGASGSWGEPEKPSLKVTDPPKSGGAAAKKDPLAEAKRYLENLQKQFEKTKDLSVEEQTLLDIQKKRIEFVTPAIEKELLATARLIDLKKAETDNLKASEDAGKKAADAAGKLVAENQKYLEAVETPFEKLQRQLEELATAVDANPLIGAETAARTGTKYWQDYLESLEDVTKEVSKFDEFSREAAKSIQDHMGNALVDIMEGSYDKISDGFVKMINRMVADAMAANLARALFGDLVQGGSGNGMAGDLLGTIGKGLLGIGGGSESKTTGDFARMDRGLPSFDVGTDFVPYDMVAKIHKGERIVPAAQNRPGAAGGDKIVNVNVTPPAGGSRATAMQWGADAGREIQRAMSRNS
jgi:type VI protein secretion system component VasK